MRPFNLGVRARPVPDPVAGRPSAQMADWAASRSMRACSTSRSAAAAWHRLRKACSGNSTQARRSFATGTLRHPESTIHSQSSCGMVPVMSILNRPLSTDAPGAGTGPTAGVRRLVRIEKSVRSQSFIEVPSRSAGCWQAYKHALCRVHPLLTSADDLRACALPSSWKWKAFERTSKASKGRQCHPSGKGGK